MQCPKCEKEYLTIQTYYNLDVGEEYPDIDAMDYVYYVNEDSKVMCRECGWKGRVKDTLRTIMEKQAQSLDYYLYNNVFEDENNK